METSIWSRLSKFDVYPKTQDDFYVRTTGGAIVSFFSVCFILYLFFSELFLYLTPERSVDFMVDTSRGQKLQINMNVTFPEIACSMLSLDAMDISGEQQLDVYHHVFKKRLDKDGNPVGTETKADDLGDDGIDGLQANDTYCGSCYGAEDEEVKCCNTCESVRKQYRKHGWAVSSIGSIEQCKREGFLDQLQQEMGEGCNVHGRLEVNKVAGNFHFAPGRSYQQAHMHVHDLQAFGTDSFNLTHIIHRLSFGDDYPGIVNPLDGLVSATDSDGPAPMIQYFVKVVPTIFEGADGTVISTNQFAVTEHSRTVERDGGRSLPGVFVFYDLSPIMAIHRETYRSFAHFLTGCCAIIGGVFTVAGIVDSVVYTAQRKLAFKAQLGKAG